MFVFQSITKAKQKVLRKNRKYIIKTDMLTFMVFL